MEMLTLSTELLLFVFGCIFTLFKLKKTLSSQNKSRLPLPPGPFRWPVLGNVIEMKLTNGKYPHLALASMARKYGDIMSLGFGVHYAVVVSSFDAMKELFKKVDVNTSRYEFPFVADRAFQKNLGIIWSSGTPWREMRRFTAKSFKDFGLGKTKSMEIIMTKEMGDLVQIIQSSIENDDGVLEIHSTRLAATTINILWSLMGGLRFPLGDKTMARNLQNNDDIVEVIGYNNIYTVFPFLKNWFPKWSQYERHMEINADTHSFVMEIIETIKIKRSEREDKTAQNLIESFLDEIQRNSNNPDSNFTDEQLILVLMDLFLGGSETTSTALNWAIVFLVLNPKIQKKVQDEIDKVLKPDSPVSIHDVGSIPYLKATIFEVLRMANLVPVPPPRKATVDINFKGYFIPKGTSLFYNFEPVFRDVKHWGDPQVFRPERFLDSTGTQVVNTERVPGFGFGTRSCPGEALAWDTMSMFMMTVFRNFTFEEIPGHPPSVEEPNSAATLSPRPYSVRVRYRNKTSN